MKKIIVALTSIAMCIAMFTGVSFAAATVTAQASFDAASNTLTVTGTATSSQVFIAVTTASDTTSPIVQTFANVTNGAYSYSTDFSGYATGDYVVSVKNSSDHTVATATFTDGAATSSSSVTSGNSSEVSSETSSTPASSSTVSSSSSAPASSSAASSAPAVTSGVSPTGAVTVTAAFDAVGQDITLTGTATSPSVYVVLTSASDPTSPIWQDVAYVTGGSYSYTIDTSSINYGNYVVSVKNTTEKSVATAPVSIVAPSAPSSSEVSSSSSDVSSSEPVSSSSSDISSSEPVSSSSSDVSSSEPVSSSSSDVSSSTPSSSTPSSSTPSSSTPSSSVPSSSIPSSGTVTSPDGTVTETLAYDSGAGTVTVSGTATGDMVLVYLRSASDLSNVIWQDTAVVTNGSYSYQLSQNTIQNFVDGDYVVTIQNTTTLSNVSEAVAAYSNSSSTPSSSTPSSSIPSSSTPSSPSTPSSSSTPTETDTLKAQIAKAKALNKSDYTQVSWNANIDAINKDVDVANGIVTGKVAYLKRSTAVIFPGLNDLMDVGDISRCGEDQTDYSVIDNGDGYVRLYNMASGKYVVCDTVQTDGVYKAIIKPTLSAADADNALWKIDSNNKISPKNHPGYYLSDDPNHKSPAGFDEVNAINTTNDNYTISYISAVETNASKPGHAYNFDYIQESIDALTNDMANLQVPSPVITEVTGATLASAAIPNGSVDQNYPAPVSFTIPTTVTSLSTSDFGVGEGTLALYSDAAYSTPIDTLTVSGNVASAYVKITNNGTSYYYKVSFNVVDPAAKYKLTAPSTATIEGSYEVANVTIDRTTAAKIANPALLVIYTVGNVQIPVVEPVTVTDTTSTQQIVAPLGTTSIMTYLINSDGTFDWTSGVPKNLSNISTMSVSYAKTGWTATAYKTVGPTDPVTNAIDADSTTRWASGEGVNSSDNEWFQVDFGKSLSFSSISILTNATDFPDSYEVDVSNNGTTWTTVTSSAAAQAGTTTISFSKQNARYVKLVPHGNKKTSWWCIYDINVAP